ncbi:MAG: hypothetical protein JXN61_13335 [Sedimentisphaerales bacterium]|nr:hypothetical protein [Sedimentisphaerales bacterium]
METRRLYAFAVRRALLMAMLGPLAVTAGENSIRTSQFTVGAAVGGAVRYRLMEGSYLIDDCTICGRPTIPVPIRGSFWLKPTGENPLFSYYAVRGLRFESSSPHSEYVGHFNGTYQAGGEVALVQQMTLQGRIDEFGVLEFDSGMVMLQAPFPWIEIDLAQVPPSDPLHTFSLHFVAVPWPEIWFSTETGFTSSTMGMVSVSEGDLLSARGRVVRTNYRLTANLGIMPIVPDIGLDAVIGQAPAASTPAGSHRCRIWFSSREDIYSESFGPLRNGDLLDSAGAIARRHDELIGPFSPEPPIPQFGLDAAAIGPEGQVLFSTGDGFFSESLGVMISDGDLLDERGLVFKSSSDLMRNFQPIDPMPKVFGLDAAYVWPNGEVWFSITTSFTDLRLGHIGYGDLLSDTGRVVIRNLDLLGPFAPVEDLADFGLDTVTIVWPGPGNINGTGPVDMGDFAVLAQDWQRDVECPCESSDLDCDGRVGFGDFCIMAFDWLEE